MTFDASSSSQTPDRESYVMFHEHPKSFPPDPNAPPVRPKRPPVPADADQKSAAPRGATRWALGFAVVLVALALTPAANAQAATINVSPAGNDTNPGTTTAPLKTLGKALSKAVAGDTVKLAGGGYGQGASGTGNGEQIPATGLRVPSGVTIEGATENGFPLATLLGAGGGVGLNLKGSATVRNLFVGGGPGFGVGIYARQGTQTLSNLFVVATGKTAVVDGATLSGGIALRGTAQATLIAGAAQANTTGSTLFVNGGQGVFVLEQSRFTMRGGQINAGNHTGVEVHHTARFVMDRAKIIGSRQGACPTGSGVSLADSAQATLKNQAALTNLATALTARQTAKAAVVGSAISKAYPAGCPESPSVRARESAALVFNGATIAATGGQQTVGIETGDAVTLAFKNTEITGHTKHGVDLNHNERVSIEGGRIAGNKTGVDTAGGAQGASGPHPQVRISGTLVTGNDTGILIDGGELRLRDSTVSLNRLGIALARSVIFVVHPDGSPNLCAGPCADLGTAQDPGNNDLRGNAHTAVSFNVLAGEAQLAEAVGNIWNPSTQGADGNGRYLQPLQFDGSSPIGSGTNFRLQSADTLIRLGTVGAFKLSPRTLTARPGRTAVWRLVWTHPVDWKRLDQIVLRLEDHGKPVGRVLVDQETRRLRASSSAVRLAPGRSAVSRGQAGGKRVTARLALRIAGRYAGRTLVAKVAATDDAGNRQAFRTAGRVRVLDR